MQRRMKPKLADRSSAATYTAMVFIYRNEITDINFLSIMLSLFIIKLWII